MAWISVLMMGLYLLSGAVMADEQPLYSDPQEDEERVRVTANELESDTTRNISVFKGDVRVVQGDTVISCQELTIYHGDTAPQGGRGSIESVIATGAVKIIMENRIGLADQAEYSMKTGDIVLTGEPAKVTTGNNSVAGKKITINRNDSRMTVERGSSQRVEAVLYPDENRGE